MNDLILHPTGEGDTTALVPVAGPVAGPVAVDTLWGPHPRRVGSRGRPSPRSGHCRFSPNFSPRAGCSIRGWRAARCD